MEHHDDDNNVSKQKRMHALYDPSRHELKHNGKCSVKGCDYPADSGYPELPLCYDHDYGRC